MIISVRVRKDERMVCSYFLYPSRILSLSWVSARECRLSASSLRDSLLALLSVVERVSLFYLSLYLQLTQYLMNLFRCGLDINYLTSEMIGLSLSQSLINISDCYADISCQFYKFPTTCSMALIFCPILLFSISIITFRITKSTTNYYPPLIFLTSAFQVCVLSPTDYGQSPNLFTIFTYQFMKTQILSRIQSYQNISTTNTSSMKKISFFPHNNQNELRQKNRNGNPHEDDPYQSAKFLIPSLKVSTNKLFQSSTTLDPFKKLTNKSIQKQAKKQANEKYKSLQKNRENRLYKMEKKMSSDYKKEAKSQNSIADLPHLIHKGSKIHSSANKTQTYKTISNPRINGTKTVAGSESQIKLINENQTPEKNQIKSKPINFLMKTVNVFKDYKQSPYFAFSNKKSENFKPDKTRPVRSLYRVSTEAMNDKQQDVSIQISVQNIETEEKGRMENQNDTIEFGCSQIEEKSMENDSSFLDSTQKEIIKQISMMSQKEETRRRIWKKLPNDFLKF